MMQPMLRGIAGITMALVSVTGAAAQESTQRVAANTDWSVFVEKGDCWVVSAPKETVNSKDGKPVQVRRGDILLFVTYRKGAGGPGEVSFTGGYPFAPGSNVDLDIGGTTYTLFTDGEWAWSGSKDEDTKIVSALKGGSSAVMTARSAKGTQTKDTFSLLGLTAMTDEAAKRCQ